MKRTVFSFIGRLLASELATMGLIRGEKYDVRLPDTVYKKHDGSIPRGARFFTAEAHIVLRRLPQAGEGESSEDIPVVPIVALCVDRLPFLLQP